MPKKCIFYLRNVGFNKKQIAYLSGLIDSRRSFFFHYNKQNVYKNVFIPQVRINNRDYKLSKLIARKYKKEINKNAANLFLHNEDAIDFTRQVFEFLITNKDKANYLIDWYKNKDNEKKQYEIIYKSLINYPYEQGNHEKSIQILKDKYREKFKVNIK